MDRRSVLAGIGVVGGAVGIGAALQPALGSPSTIDGTVEAKSITGKQSDTSYGILLAHEGHLGVEDETYEDDFETWRRVVVDDDLEQRLRFDYRTLQYNVHVRHDSSSPQFDADVGESLAYRATREQFNAAGIGDEISFSIADGRAPEIEELTDTPDT